MKFYEAMKIVVESEGRKGMRLPQWKPYVHAAYANADTTCGLKGPVIYLQMLKRVVPWHVGNAGYLVSDKWEVVDLPSQEDEAEKQVVNG